MPVGKIVVPKTVQKPPLPREDATEVLVGMVAVPKTGQKPPPPDCPKSAFGKSLRVLYYR